MVVRSLPWRSLSRWRNTRRCLSTTRRCATDDKAFADTLLLPKTEFPLRPNQKNIELEFGKLTREELYRWQEDNVKGPVFVLHDGPPYANGDLHMGHALNKVIKDIINRFQLTQGRRIHYVPGWDCHGLPIENKALKEMECKAIDTPPAVIRRGAKTTALREVASQKEQFRALGIMADWDSEAKTYRTLDRHYEIRQLRIFQKMVKKGQIYRQHRPVYYSPSSRTALAEAELEYSDNHVSHSVYVTFDLDLDSVPTLSGLSQVIGNNSAKVQVLVWTTTPWTLSANMAIAVHPDLWYTVVKPKAQDAFVIVADELLDSLDKVLGNVEIVGRVKGSDLIGVRYIPIFPASTTPLPIIGAKHVTSTTGTGLVHCAPAHGAEDYEALRDSVTDFICHVDASGEFSSEISNVVGALFAERLIGKEVLNEGNKEMVDLLKKLGRVLKVQRIKHRYPYDWRTKQPIIVTATSQWFANLDFIKEDALEALKDVSFFPATSRNRLESFVKSRSEWCISRQRVWGVPIPALHHLRNGSVVLDPKSLECIINVMETKNLDWWEAPIEEFVPPWLLEEGRSAAQTWEKGRDTMDVWFDSGSSWSMLPELVVGRRPTGTEADSTAQRKFHADLCLEGSDQHRGWFQSQLLTAVGSRDASDEPTSPYGQLLTHGMVLDEKGKKMSKSLGNIISPMTIVCGDSKQPAYGPDFLRLWAASVDFWKEMSIGPIVIAQSAESLRKLRNTARFCLGNMGPKHTLEVMQRVPRSEMGLIEKYVMHELYVLEQAALAEYAAYNFPRVIHALNNFVNNTMSSFYFDITKDCLYADEVNSQKRRAVVTVLEQVLGTLTRIISPVLPYLAEEIHATWKGDGKSVFMTPWVPLSDEWENKPVAHDMGLLLQTKDTALSLLEQARRQKQVKSPLEADIDIVIPEDQANGSLADLLRQHEEILKTIFVVSDVKVHTGKHPNTSGLEWSHKDIVAGSGISLRVRSATQHKCPRCWTFTRPDEDRLCKRCEEVLSQN